LRWRSDEERDRQEEETDLLDLLGDPEKVQRELGRRYADDVLPDYLLMKYFAFALADNNATEYFKLIELDRLQLTEAFVMKRTSQYLSLEDPKKSRRQMPSDD
jgi:hypothetical protein